jgi:hypothetical protein
LSCLSFFFKKTDRTNTKRKKTHRTTT